MRRLYETAIVGLLLAGLACVALSQQPDRQMQVGVKTSDPGYVASLKVDVPIQDMESAEAIVVDGYELLAEAMEADGWTLVGKGRVVFEVSMTNLPGEVIPLRLQLFLIDQPTDEELQSERDYELLKLDEQKVAYTFHKGPAKELQGTFMKLVQWMIGEGLDMTGFPCAIIHDLSLLAAPEVYEVQMPAK